MVKRPVPSWCKKRERRPGMPAMRRRTRYPFCCGTGFECTTGRILYAAKRFSFAGAVYGSHHVDCYVHCSPGLCGYLLYGKRQSVHPAG